MVQDRIPVGTRFSACPDQPWGPPNLLYNGYRVFPGGKVRPGRAADHSPPSSAVVTEQLSYTSTHPLGHTGPITGSLYLYLYVSICGQGSSVSIATDYGLDGPGSNPGGGEIFHPPRPALGPTQPPVQWVPSLSRW